MAYVYIASAGFLGIVLAFRFGLGWLFCISLFALFIAIASIHDHFKWKKIALARGKPDICRFAHQFDRRTVDTKVIREVFEAVQDWMGTYNGVPFPVEASDDFDEYYAMDPFDLEDIHKDISKKLNRSMENPMANPYWRKVKTVKDLVMFIHHQPKLI